MTQTTLRNGGVVDAVVPCGLGGNPLATWARDFACVNHQWSVSVSSPEEPRSDRPTWLPIMLSICEVELEEVSGHERQTTPTRSVVSCSSRSSIQPEDNH